MAKPYLGGEEFRYLGGQICDKFVNIFFNYLLSLKLRICQSVERILNSEDR